GGNFGGFGGNFGGGGFGGGEIGFGGGDGILFAGSKKRKSPRLRRGAVAFFPASGGVFSLDVAPHAARGHPIGKGVPALAIAGLVGLASYLAMNGASLKSVNSWVRRQLDIRVDKPELKDVPYPGYSPVVVPGR